MTYYNNNVENGNVNPIIIRYSSACFWEIKTSVFAFRLLNLDERVVHHVWRCYIHVAPTPSLATR